MKLLDLFMQISHFTFKNILFTFKVFRKRFLARLKIFVFADESLDGRNYVFYLIKFI